ncbi:quinone oxidoreductase [Moesziomyces antarcticus]|uniref:Related to NADPH quinone oxidoreductase homolog PIG3 n=1 Tax=Pseudozyma antarctica TaxID=84753 RepID=A0A5C3FI60_PSEA2|nr:quinone oxidoreductase [Moesziomyces antarcticus]GAK62544.1 quinone oxidoreductase [Moesziomyces antarcticus]SPO43099.1 related to NADPH quinone oxidoreductase homolog PIG3 [Moesziomyces antarcticus]
MSAAARLYPKLLNSLNSFRLSKPIASLTLAPLRPFSQTAVASSQQRFASIHRPSAVSSIKSFKASASTGQTRAMSSDVPSQMKAILVKDGKGPSSNLYLGEAPVPELGDDEVLVKIKAFGLNRMDIMQREGNYPLPPHAPQIMGVEFSGHVVATKNLKDVQWKVGQEVFGLAVGGAYAEYIKVPARMILEKPSELDWVKAAAIPENYLTAFQALRTICELKQGEDVLIHAGASGVGLAAIQLARAFGANKIYVTAGSQEKIQICEDIGADKGFNYKAGDWAEELAKHTGAQGPAGSVDVIVDFVGAPYFTNNLNSLKRDGRMVLLAFMGGAKVKEIVLAQLLFKRLRVEGSALRSRSLEYQSKLVQGFVKENGLERLIAGARPDSSGKHHSKLIIHKVYSWNDIKDAHDEMEANKNIGKIVITIDGA